MRINQTEYHIAGKSGWRKIGKFGKLPVIHHTKIKPSKLYLLFHQMFENSGFTKFSPTKFFQHTVVKNMYNFCMKISQITVFG